MPRQYHYPTRARIAQRGLIAAQHAAQVKQASDIAAVEANVSVDVSAINDTLATVNATLADVNATLTEVDGRLETLENAA